MSKNAKSETEVPESNTKKEISITVVPVEVAEPPPPPPKLERQTNKAYSREEALSDPANEADEYEQVASKPVPPKPLTRVDKLRMLARQGLP